MSAKEKAVADIKDELQQEGKVFIQFVSELDETMDAIVLEYSQEQDRLAICLSTVALK